MILLGCDPGLTGALAWLHVSPGQAPKLLKVLDLPTIKSSFGRSKTVRAHVDIPSLVREIPGPGGLLKPDAAIIEEVGAMPKQGGTSIFRFGFVTGALTAAVQSHGVPLHTAQPSRWKPAVGLPTGSDKGAARRRAVDLFPEQSALFSRDMDHGRADAVLLAVYLFAKLSRPAS